MLGKKSIPILVVGVAFLTFFNFYGFQDKNNIKKSTVDGLVVTKKSENKPDFTVLAETPVSFFSENVQLPDQNLIDSLRGLQNLITSPFNALGAGSTFSSIDQNVVGATQQALNAVGSNVSLSEQCGIEGGSFSFPPGSDAGVALCGGTPAYGGGSCNTDRKCLYSGKCFYICTGNDCRCRIESCYGKCGKSGYLWDEATGKCGCAD